MPDIFSILLRKTYNTNIRVNSSNTSASQIRSDHQKIFLNFQRNGTDKYIFLNPYIVIHMHGYFIFFQLLLKLPLYIRQYLFKGCCIRKSITNLNPSKEICHGLRRKIISQVYRYHQCHRTLLLVLWDLLTDRTEHHSCKQHCYGHTVGTSLLMNLFYRKNYFRDMHI